MKAFALIALVIAVPTFASTSATLRRSYLINKYSQDQYHNFHRVDDN